MSQDIITKGNLEYRERQAGKGTEFKPVLVRCPVCEQPFKKGMHRSSHIATHQPEEFGLTPMMHE